ncbi:MAG: hypothetical protein DRJ42_20000 [Deltaproteobacteria bacterium]|nr:MAG: hypothetical protein DRJ42_20000 [Deltaproteobacteria bacterium]
MTAGPERNASIGSSLSLSNVILLVPLILSSLFPVGCTDDGYDWIIDLRTDLAPGEEFARVRIEVTPLHPDDRTRAGEPISVLVVDAMPSADYLRGVRIAELSGVAPGVYELHAVLIARDGTEVVARNLIVRLRENLANLVLLTRNCRGVMCPEAGGDPSLSTCEGGVCVSPGCGDDDLAACAPIECVSSDDCSATVACAEGRCSAGRCLEVQRTDGCATGERCDLDLGCVEARIADSGVSDASVDTATPADTGAAVDTGMMCAPTAEVCNGLDDDCDGTVDEDFDLTTTSMCGACDRACILGWSCTAGTCVRPPDPPSGPADEYLVGDWDGDGDDNLAVRYGQCVWMDVDEDTRHDIRQCFGNPGDIYLVGDWDGDGRDNLGALRSDCVYLDTNFDGTADGSPYCFGNPGDTYFAGDWDADGDGDIAVERDACLLMDTNRGGGAEFTHCLGNPGERYLIGDWNGDGDDDAAALRDACVLIDETRNGVPERTVCFGNPSDVFLVGDWDGDGDDDLAVIQPSRCVQLDLNDVGGAAEAERCYGAGL